MTFLAPLIEAVAQGLRFINTKESRKYLDEMMELKQGYSDELLKPLVDQSDLKLITLQRRVLVIYEAYLQFKPEASNS